MIGMKTKIECGLKHSERLLQRTFAEVYSRKFLGKCVMRRFRALSGALHERLPFSLTHKALEQTTIFDSVRCRLGDGWEAAGEHAADVEPDKDKVLFVIWHKWHAYLETHEASKEALVQKDPEFMPACLWLSGVNGPCNNADLSCLQQCLRSISVPDNAEEIPNKCFYQCESLQRVAFGRSSVLKRIGLEAFYGCALTEILIPDSVEEFDGKCFSECQSLSCVTFGDSSSLKRIGVSAFGNSALVEIHIPDTVEQICDKSFCECGRLTRVTFGESSALKRIGIEAFARCGLVEIHVPDSVEEIGQECFYGCDRLSRVKLRESSSLKRIGNSAFSRSTLVEFRMPNSVEEIGQMCFAMCKFRRVTCGESALRRFVYRTFCSCCLSVVCIPDYVEELGVQCFSACEQLSRVTFGKSPTLARIGARCFAGSGLEHISLPATVVSVGGCAFSPCPLSRFEISDANVSLTVVDGLLLSKDGRVCYSCVGSLDHVVIPDSVEEICDECFGCVSRVTFGPSSSLKRIGIEAFSESGLSEIHIPDSVEEICDKCFCWCDALSRVTFGESSSLKRIGVEAFCRCPLAMVIIPDNVEELCERCFYECRNLVDVLLRPTSQLKRIGVRCFAESGLEQIILPLSVVSIGGSAFSGCNVGRFEHLSSHPLFTVNSSLLLSKDNRVCYGCTGTMQCVVIPDSVEEICDQCFYENGDSSRFTFGESPSLKRIGIEAFFGSILEEIAIPDSVEEICDKCFCNCVCLCRVTFGASSSVKRLGIEAFYGCVYLEEIQIPESVEKLCDKCFCGCSGLSCVQFGEPSRLKLIGESCFAYCGLDDFSLPGSVVSIGGSAFSECPLRRFEISDANCSFTVVNGLLLSKDRRVLYSRIGYLSEAIIPDSVEELCDKCFIWSSSLSCVTFGKSSSLKRIGTDAFYECPDLMEVCIPSTLEELLKTAVHASKIRIK